MGEAIEAGAEQIVGLVILPLGGALGWLALQFSPEGDAEAAAAAHDTLAHDLLNYGASFAQSHPVYYLAVDLGGLLIIALVVLYEADPSAATRPPRYARRATPFGEEGAGGDSANGGAGGGGGAGPRAAEQGFVTSLHRDLRRAQVRGTRAQAASRRPQRTMATAPKRPPGARAPLTLRCASSRSR